MNLIVGKIRKNAASRYLKTPARIFSAGSHGASRHDRLLQDARGYLRDDARRLRARVRRSIARCSSLRTMLSGGEALCTK